jgi:hypothetical protein
MTDSAITRERIATTPQLIGPHVRRTPVLTTDLRDFGLAYRETLLSSSSTSSIPGRSRFAAHSQIF